MCLVVILNETSSTDIIVRGRPWSIVCEGSRFEGVGRMQNAHATLQHMPAATGPAFSFGFINAKLTGQHLVCSLSPT